MNAPPKKLTAVAIQRRKRPEAEPLVMLTAYDFPTARALDAAGVDILLVGDSLAMVVLGHDSTLPVTMDEMLHHTRAVARAKTRALVVGDMPWMSYHAGLAEAVTNAGRFIKEAGADAVKLEGGTERLEVIRAVVSAQIPVMGHLGLTPQSVLKFGGYRVQGRGEAAVEALTLAARALEEAGCFAIVLEGVPRAAARTITEAVTIPTIGIGAGPDTDGQVLVIHDLAGFGGEVVPRFVRRYAEVGRLLTDAARHFADDVRSGRYPDDSETYPE
jgi:3-methyl-2-oxobutanoate hydroxymethyltransferase